MALDFVLIMNRSEPLSIFAEELDIWKDAILTYAKASKSHPKKLHNHLSDSYDESKYYYWMIA